MNNIYNNINMIDYKKLKTEQIVDLLLKADNEYYNIGEPSLSDNEYDEIRDYLKTIDKKNEYFKKIGAEILNNKIKLPYFLGSQDKIKDDEKILNKWLNKYDNPSSYIISEKLDGISCLITYNKSIIKLYTRGNGIYGQDITQFKDYIKGIQPLKDKNIALRGELIINKNNWSKISDKGSNARNVVAGIINSKTLNKELLQYVEFVVYDVIEPRLKIEDSLKYAKELKFNIVNYIIEPKLSIELLYDLLKKWKDTSKYEIDGLVVIHNNIYKIKTGENPKYSFAFKSLKMQQDIEVIVTDIEWNISKDKYLKPIVKFDEIQLNGVKIKKATGFNADYIVKNKIGIGSKIKIIRSGDVIPYIKEIITFTKPLLPSVPYKWKGKDIILDSENKNRDQDIKNYNYFMKALNIKGIGEGIITKLYDNSYDTLEKIINIKKEELLNIEGFKDKSSDNLIKSLNEIKHKSCLELMNASNILGRGLGEKKLKLLFDSHPYICNNQEKALKLTVDDLKKINGLGDISAGLIISNLKLFFDFYNTLNINKDNKKIVKDEIKINPKYNNNIYVFSGIRNKELEKIIENSGGKISNTVSKKTTALIVKDKNENTTKIQNAIKYNIPIIIYNEFIK